ncbi:MAG: sugar ABC transporter ATP-binding protein [Acidobacteria bacterium]|nr:sugar ABC transporter ATP-binding protein [Acidobacteriota bacterium]
MSHKSMAGLEFRDVHKSFGAVKALRGVSFTVEEGESHALVGENGAGKSTLLKMLAGILRADSGEFYWHGDRLDLGSPREGLERGIGMVYQETLCFPNLTVTGNIFAGRELTTGGRLREAEMRQRTRALLDELHLSIDPDDVAESLSAAHRQLLQVARALAFDCRILVLDEPTTSLTDAEADHLFAVLQKLKRRGVTLLYVSHRLPEVFRLCDRITVLRDGAYVGTFPRDEVTHDHIVHAMVGRDLPPRTVDAARHAETPVLEIDGLTRRPYFTAVSLSVHSREIVGLFGLMRRATSRDVLIRSRKERREAEDLVHAWRIKAPGVEVRPDTLSGGNQQKVVLAKWLATSPRVLLLDEPTKGVDVGAKFEIHEIVRRQAADGMACLVVSSDLPEVLALAHRIVVMREGRVQGTLVGADATEQAVMHLATAEHRDAS